jgi:hypothetical protein
MVDGLMAADGITAPRAVEEDGQETRSAGVERQRVDGAAPPAPPAAGRPTPPKESPRAP